MAADTGGGPIAAAGVQSWGACSRALVVVAAAVMPPPLAWMLVQRVASVIGNDATAAAEVQLCGVCSRALVVVAAAVWSPPTWMLVQPVAADIGVDVEHQQDPTESTVIGPSVVSACAAGGAGMSSNCQEQGRMLL